MTSDETPLRVLARPAFENRRENPYNWLLYSGLRARGVTVDEFGAKNLLLGRYDICHVHWPESTFNASLFEALTTTRALLHSLDWLSVRKTKLLWTAHNLRAHERRFSQAEEAFWAEFVARLDGFIALSQASLELTRQRFPELEKKPAFVVPHPHYRGQYPDGVARSQARARLGLAQDARVVLFFGRILEYKNVPALIRSVRALRRQPSGADVVALIAGRPHDRAIAEAVKRAAGTDPGVALHLSFVSQKDAQFYFRAADLVALPYREILNSGSAVLALGFDRPVLMPRKGAGEELARSIGGDWVQLYDELLPEAIGGALTRSAALPPVTDGRQLAPLDPAAAVSRTLEAYRSLLRPAPPRGTSLPVPVGAYP
ncbi:MAG TPA: glycosyltransferase [Polyangiaceae bacterium]|nr:glycosyltransferase [Polyangiaceae bacterium]